MVIDSTHAWDALLLVSAQAKQGVALGTKGAEPLGPNSPVIADAAAPRSWQPASGYEFSPDAIAMLNLYMPLCVGSGANDMVAAHLGQSLDGRIATHNGVSQFITGEENLVHTHRMRALFDAVVVGAHTAEHDNPRLTTRLTSGDHATRVLIDPSCSAKPSASIFVDGMAETIVICAMSHVPDKSEMHIGLETENGVFPPSTILSALRDRGLRRIFIEGGGITVSQFLGAGALDRLHICVAPMIIGSGRPAVVLPQVSSLADSHFLKVSHFDSGPDILFDCELRANAK